MIGIDGYDALGVARQGASYTPGTTGSAAAPRKSTATSAAAAGQVDVPDKLDIKLDIQAQAVTQKQEKPAGPNTWEARFGLEAGSSILDNGNRQVVTIDGSSMEIFEYDGDSLVRHETGEIAGSRVIREVEYYGADGKVSQSARVVLTTEGDKADGPASMERSMQWFENGELVRSLADSMRVEADFKVLAQFTLPGKTAWEQAEGMVVKLTQDHVVTDYDAVLESYEGGDLVESLRLEQDADATQITNRSSVPIAGQAAWSSVESSKASGLKVSITNWNHEGELLRTAEFSDETVVGGGQEQRSRVSWFEDGELVKTSQGSYRSERTPESELEKRPTVLELLSITEEEFSSMEPKTATELLDRLGNDAMDQGDLFSSVARNDFAGPMYASVDSLVGSGFTARPYEVQWTSSEYRDGDLVARQEDSQELKENPRPPSDVFAVGRGLSEDKTASRLYESRHMDESYEEGRTVKSAELRRRETIHEDEDGMRSVWTHSMGTAGQGAERRVARAEQAGRIPEIDPEFERASTLLGADIVLTLRSSSEALLRVKPEDGE
jgi:hypothetical protein